MEHGSSFLVNHNGVFYGGLQRDSARDQEEFHVVQSLQSPPRPLQAQALVQVQLMGQYLQQQEQSILQGEVGIFFQRRKDRRDGGCGNLAYFHSRNASDRILDFRDSPRYQSLHNHFQDLEGRHACSVVQGANTRVEESFRGESIGWLV